MPRALALTPSPISRATDFAGSPAERCGRAGAYRPGTLAARFGDAALPDVLTALAVYERAST